MNTIHRIIADSDVLIPMGDVEENFFKNISVDKLNTYFNNVINKPQYTNIIKRIAPIYDGIYPDDKEELIQLIKDLDLLGSKKLTEILVLLDYYYHDDTIDFIETTIPAVQFEYDQIKFGDNFKNKLILNDLVDLLKIKYELFTLDDITLAGINDSVKVFKYIWEFIGDDDVLINIFDRILRYPQKHDEDFNIIKCIFDIALKDDIIRTKLYLHKNDYRLLKVSCQNGNFETVKYIWNISLQDGVGKLNLHADDEEPFRFACFSGNIELVQWIWDKCIFYNSKINLDGTLPMIITLLLSFSRFSMIKYLYNLSLNDGAHFNLNGFSADNRNRILNS